MSRAYRRKLGGMTKSQRKLNITKYKSGFAIAGRCSACHRPFEVDFSIEDSLPRVEVALKELFDAHNCDEDISQAAFRVVQEATED